MRSRLLTAVRTPGNAVTGTENPTRRIVSWGGRGPEARNLTVHDLRMAKGKRRFTQVTANTAEEAQAACEAGIDLIIANSRNAAAAREGGKHLFLTAAIALADHPTADDVLREAFQAMSAGADAVMTQRPLPVVEMLAREDIPVMGHLGLVPRKSTWIGGLRAVGKTRAEALTLHRRFRQLEDAGAFGVEAELIPDRIMGAISARTGLVTFSLGSGQDADVMYLFMEDICGENVTRPRHARAFGDIASLHRAIRVERVDALKRFRECALGGGFPGPRETVSVPDREYESFVRALDAQAKEGPA